jgi:hypothetical protein
MSSGARGVTAKAANSRALEVLARLGYAVNGLVHGLIGAIAIGVAIGRGGQANQSGALSQLAQNPAGVALLWVIVIGLLALGLWQILHAFLIPAPDPKRKWVHRAGELGKAIAYLFVAATAFTFARGSSTNSASSSESFSAKLLSAPGGVFLLFLVGLAVIAIGIVFIVRGATRKFLDAIRVPAGPMGRAATVLGIVGYIAKGVVLAVVGVFFCVAAVTFDPNKATGLDGALKNIAQLPFGTIILILLGIGLIAYGVYCVFRARLARL